MWTPGAVISGWYSGSSGMPRDEKSASTCARGSLLVGASGFEPSSSMQWASEFVGSATPILQPAATPMTHGATLYGFNVFWLGPSFPARSEEHTSGLQTPYDRICGLRHE